METELRLYETTTPYIHIPDELKQLDQWVLHDDEKIPKQPNNENASSTNPNTWGDYWTALEAWKNRRRDFRGIGFVVQESNGYVLIDIDKCRNKSTGVIADWAMQIIRKMNSYTEISISGTGIHIFVKGIKTKAGNKKKFEHGGAIEIYDDARFFTMSGNRLDEFPSDIIERKQEIAELCEQYLDDLQVLDNNFVYSKSKLTDADIIKMASNDKNGKKFQEGFFGGHGADASATELSICNHLAFYTKDPEQIYRIMQNSALVRNKWDKPIKSGGDTYILYTIKKAIQGTTASYDPKKSKREEKDWKEFLNYEEADQGNAERLVWLHGENIRFCFERKEWLIWNEKIWEPDNTGEITRLAVATMRKYRQSQENWKKKLMQELEELPKKIKEEFEQALKENPERGQELADEFEKKGKEKAKELKEKIKITNSKINFAIKSLSNGKLKAMIELAAHIRGISISVTELDKDKHLVNCLNGTYDLKEKKFREHRKEDFITKVAGFNYDQNAQAPRWKRFIDEIMLSDKEKVGYIQRWLGYALSGYTSESIFPIGYGHGANGKSVFMSIALQLLGDYAAQASAALFMAKKNDGSPNPELVQIQGKRLVFVSETSEGKHLDEQFIKSITGNDTIVARGLFQKSIQFKPVAKIFMATNHKPLVRGADTGIWRRLQLLPFGATFEGEKRDIHLEEKLVAELAGIFNWALEGFVEWEKTGVNLPKSMNIATLEYKKNMDSIGNFLDDMCVVHAEARGGVKEVYEAYKMWCNEMGENPMKNRMFKNRLEEKGFQQKRTKSARYWDGFGLQSDNPHLQLQDKKEVEEVIQHVTKGREKVIL